MSRAIHKASFPRGEGEVVLMAGEGCFEILHVGEQDGLVTFWYMTLSDASLWQNRYRIELVGTGWTVPFKGEYAGTVQMNSGLVWHLYGQWIK